MATTIPTNQAKRSSVSVGVATANGVYVGGRKVAHKQGNYLGGVIVMRTSEGVHAVVRVPTLVASTGN